MYPPYQRFHPRDLARLKVEFRLVVQHKLIAPKSVAQIPFEQLSLCDSYVHLASEELIVIPTLLFGFVHRGVCFIHQGFCV